MDMKPTKSELIAPRYIVKNYMPGAQFSHLLPGDVLVKKSHPLIYSTEIFGHEDETDVNKWVTICPYYPHLFRKLHWTEFRALYELPDKVSYGSKIGKAEWSTDENGELWLKVDWDKEPYLFRIGNEPAYFLPAD